MAFIGEPPWLGVVFAVVVIWDITPISSENSPNFGTYHAPSLKHHHAPSHEEGSSLKHQDDNMEDFQRQPITVTTSLEETKPKPQLLYAESTRESSQVIVVSSGSKRSNSSELNGERNDGIKDIYVKSDKNWSALDNSQKKETIDHLFKEDNKRISHNGLLNIGTENKDGIVSNVYQSDNKLIQQEQYREGNIFSAYTNRKKSRRSERSAGDLFDSTKSKKFQFTETLLIPSLDSKELQELPSGFSFVGSGSEFPGENSQSESWDTGSNQSDDDNFASFKESTPDLGFLPSGFVPREEEEEGCRCWHTHDGSGKPEVECRCQGEHIRDLTMYNMSRNVNRLTLTKVGLERLRKQDLVNYTQALQEIILQDVKHLQEIETGTFANLPNLQTIYILHAPQLQLLPPNLFHVYLPNLKILRMVKTGLVEVPVLSQLHTNPDHILHMVDLENNKIRTIKPGSITIRAEQLLLSYNALEYVDQWAFNGSEIGKLSMKGNRKLTALHEMAFAGLKSLVSLDLSETSITHLPTWGLESLEELRLRETYSLKIFPSVFTFKSITKAELTYPYHCCAFKFPKIHDPHKYKENMDFIKRMESKDCSEMIPAPPVPPTAMWGKRRRRRRSLKQHPMPDEENKLNQLRMQQQNYISNLKNKREIGSKSENNMESNYIYYHNDAVLSTSQTPFAGGTQDIGFKGYDDSHSDFHSGAQPGFEDGFLGPNHGLNGEADGFYDDSEFGNSIFGSSGPFVEFAGYDGIPEGSFGGVDMGFGDGGFGDLEGGFGPIGPNNEDGSKSNFNDGDHGGSWNTPIPPRINRIVNITCGKLSKNYRLVQCSPEPDAFNPCEDIMGNIGLRIAVWVVVFLAVLGNLSVMVVLMSTRFKMSVSKFLMCNLAIADLCMGLYLLMIAAMDLHTIGEYFNYAIDWQNGPGCKIAGFLTVFASELSILTLTVITLERWYTITYAIHLNKRLRLKAASRVMVLAWAYAIIMAILPLVGVSEYSKTSICLPMETRDMTDIAYLLILLITNGLAFILICVCYGKMYCSIAGNNLAANTSDTTVAKRMALLVFTDFACWAPIAFFGLTAVSGYPLINVTHAKFLLVFFYPLNSCANPYLYAILTKQYRRDFFILLARYGFCTKRAVKYKGAYSSNNTLMNHNIVMGSAKGNGSGPCRRISTLTQVTCVTDSRNKNKTSSIESLDVPRLRSISAELAGPGADVVAKMVDRRQSDVGRRLQPVVESQTPQGITGSPHPIKNCQARMSFTPEQEALLMKYVSDRNLSSDIPKVRHKSDPGLDDKFAYAEVSVSDMLTAPTSNTGDTPVTPESEDRPPVPSYTATGTDPVITPASPLDDRGLSCNVHIASPSNSVPSPTSSLLDEGVPLHTLPSTSFHTYTIPPSPHQQPSTQIETVT